MQSALSIYEKALYKSYTLLVLLNCCCYPVENTLTYLQFSYLDRIIISIWDKVITNSPDNISKLLDVIYEEFGY